MGVIFLFSRCFVRSKWTSASDVLPSIFLAQTSTDAKIQQNDETAMVDVKAQIVFLEREK